MIRFHCLHCQRSYEVLPVLAGLPLVCKHCGQRITPPQESSASPVSQPPPAPPRPFPSPPGVLPPAITPSFQDLPPAPSGEPLDDDILVAKPDSSPDIDFNIAGPTLACFSDLQRQWFSHHQSTRLSADTLGDINHEQLPTPVVLPPPWRAVPPAVAARHAAPPRLVWPVVVDGIVGGLFIVAGVFVGEWLVGKSTRQVLSDAAFAVSFSPREWLLWAAGPVLFGLLCLLLNNRQITVGTWLRRHLDG